MNRKQYILSLVIVAPEYLVRITAQEYYKLDLYHPLDVNDKPALARAPTSGILYAVRTADNARLMGARLSNGPIGPADANASCEERIWYLGHFSGTVGRALLSGRFPSRAFESQNMNGVKKTYNRFWLWSHAIWSIDSTSILE